MSHLAQLASDYSVLYAYGPLGVICAWFMWRVEKLIDRISYLGHRIDGMTRAMMIEALSRPEVSPAARKYAEELLSEPEKGKK